MLVSSEVSSFVGLRTDCSDCDLDSCACRGGGLNSPDDDGLVNVRCGDCVLFVVSVSLSLSTLSK